MKIVNSNGVILLNKTQGPTSHDMIYEIRRIFKTKKVGHTGTLDPMATGVLPICIGNATKASDMLLSQKKEYVAEITFGIGTDTGDVTGNIISSSYFDANIERIREVIRSYVGDVMQTPPMYSAKKVNGKKLYELARAGQEIQREPVKIHIYETEYLGQGENANSFKFRVVCSKGTYIRVLCEDIGALYGCPACMSALCRTKTGAFSIEDSYTIEEIKRIVESGDADKLIIPTSELFDYDKIVLSEKQSERTKSGVFVSHPNIEENKLYRVFDNNNEFFAIGVCIEGRLRIKKSFRI